jgi:ABC-type branched-subunit amino acid transport system substrate-binding protein
LATSLLHPSGSAAEGSHLRFGLVVPAMEPRTGLVDVRVIGEAARRGALIAAEDHALAADLGDVVLDVLISAAPGAAASSRAAERLVAARGVHALIGGFSGEEAQALAEVAEKFRVPFLNIGSSSDALRDRVGHYSFHVEASASMYLTAIAYWFVGAGARDWLLIRSDSAEGEMLARKALAVLRNFDVTAGVEIDHGGNRAELMQALARVRPELVLLLVEPAVQNELEGLLRSSEYSAEAIGFPFPLTQTRDYLRAGRGIKIRDGNGRHVTLWEASSSAPASTSLDSRFLARWGSRMDPSGWAAYASVQILMAAALALGTTDGSELARYLAAGSSFGVAKSKPARFDPISHQLGQCLYLVQAGAWNDSDGSQPRLLAEQHFGCC